MNRSQVNRKEMYDAVLSYFDNSPEKWSGIPKVGEFKNTLSELVNQINEAQLAQQEAQVFLSKNKTQLKSMIAQKGDILNDCLEAFALVTDNDELAHRMSATYSDLNRARNVDFIPAIQVIISEAEANKLVLEAEYGVTAEQVEDLKSNLDDFLAINGKPRAYRIASVQATKDLEQLFVDAEALLDNKLDKVMSIFKRRDQNFYNGYQAARMVVDN